MFKISILNDQNITTIICPNVEYVTIYLKCLIKTLNGKYKVFFKLTVN